jgi:MraZ protein
MGYIKGHEVYSIDSKGRFAIPAKMRKDVSPEADSTFVVTRGVDNYIAVYPLDEWRKIERQLESLNPFDPKSRLVLNFINMYCEENKADAQNRIAIQKELLSMMGIKEKVKLIGMGNHIAIWDPEQHEKYLAGGPDYAEAFETVFSALYESSKKD